MRGRRDTKACLSFRSELSQRRNHTVWTSAHLFQRCSLDFCLYPAVWQQSTTTVQRPASVLRVGRSIPDARDTSGELSRAAVTPGRLPPGSSSVLRQVRQAGTLEALTHCGARALSLRSAASLPGFCSVLWAWPYTRAYFWRNESYRKFLEVSTASISAKHCGC